VSAKNKEITRQDLENALKGFVDDSQQTVVAAGTKAAGMAGAVAFLALAVTYVFGRRRGSRAKPVVEIRRL
jgi:hypothetical protein